MKTDIQVINRVENTVEFLRIGRKNRGGDTLGRVLQIIQAHGLERLRQKGISNITVLTNKEIVDDDWKDEFDTISEIRNSEYHYTKEDSWTSCREVTRLDFFSAKLDPQEDTNLKGDFENEYLGFCVLRPFYDKKTRVLKAIIKPLADERLFFEVLRDYFTKIRIEFENGNFIESNLRIEGFPFQQQAGRVERCAHSSISICYWYIHPIKGLLKLSELLKLCDRSKVVSPSFYKRSQEGLTYEQICSIVKEFSNPLIYSYPYRESWSKQRKGWLVKTPTKVISWYIESGIPVIIAFLGGDDFCHSVVAIGHDSNPNRWWELAKKPYYRIKSPYYSSADWVENFIIQDDNLGPYLQLPIHRLEWILAEKSTSIVIIPLFPKIRQNRKHKYIDAKEATNAQTRITRAEDAEKAGYGVVKRLVPKIAKKHLVGLLKKNAGRKSFETFKLFLQHFDSETLLFRTYLISRRIFESSFLEQNKGLVKKLLLPGSITLYQHYKNVCGTFDDYFWITEISIPEIYCYQRQYLGKIITGSLKYVVKDGGKSYTIVPWNILHLPGILFNFHSKKHVDQYFIQNDGPLAMFSGQLRNL